MYSFFKFQSLIEPGLVRKGTWREHHILPRVSSPTEGWLTVVWPENLSTEPIQSDSRKLFVSGPNATTPGLKSLWAGMPSRPQKTKRMRSRHDRFIYKLHVGFLDSVQGLFWGLFLWIGTQWNLSWSSYTKGWGPHRTPQSVSIRPELLSRVSSLPSN